MFKYGSIAGPVITTGNVSVIEQDRFSIACVSDGNPVPSYTWYIHSALPPIENQSLTITQIYRNTTNLSCVVSNVMRGTGQTGVIGSDVSSLFVNVMCK